MRDRELIANCARNIHITGTLQHQSIYQLLISSIVGVALLVNSASSFGAVACIQIPVDAWNPTTNEVREFGSPCSVPLGWIYPIPDTDKDGWLDPDEINAGSDPADANSTPPDADRDFVLDSEDNCPAVNNPQQLDTDGDGIGDACDLQTDCSIATISSNWNSVTGATHTFRTACIPEDWRYGRPDTDLDGYLDRIEVEHGSDPNNFTSRPADIDNDKLPDTSDYDIDNDGVSNLSDNCPFVANSSQTDTDGDGLGDTCDVGSQVCGGPALAWNMFTGEIRQFDTSCLPGGWSGDFVTDTDGDGWTDQLETQIYNYPTSYTLIDVNSAITPLDRDGDGIPNTEDNCPLLYDKSQKDDNNNNVGDYCEDLSDTTPPTLIAPADITADPTGELTSVNLGMPESLVGGIAWPDQFGPFTVGQHIITWTAADFANNRVTDTQIVTIGDVVDNTPPDITAPAEISFDEGATITVEMLGVASATDNVDGELTPQVETDLSSLVVGENEVIWMATDNAGNTGRATQIVSIVDKTPPVVTAPANISFDEGTTITVDMLGVASATDNVDGELTPQVETDLSSLVVGENEVIWMATDTAGNTGYATQIVTLNVGATDPAPVEPVPTVPAPTEPSPVTKPDNNSGDANSSSDGSTQAADTDSGGGSALWLPLLMMMVALLRARRRLLTLLPDAAARVAVP